MLNGVSLSSVMMVIGVLLIVLALWRLLRVFHPANRHRKAAASAETTRQEPAIGSSDSERGE
ncbi:hypothetical protein [Zymobacter sp. IVIA_5232.4 C2]|uniref:hypothetical protein n=1 Tax=Zymobacter sp. IVIA_5232.4 C2 TaxID=3394855 RepID=UPI0039C438A5